jgi:hypothetical protein
MHWKSPLDRPDRLNIERFRPVMGRPLAEAELRFTVSDREMDADGATTILCRRL